jgi:predicted Ser/Thr protein kinase
MTEGPDGAAVTLARADRLTLRRHVVEVLRRGSGTRPDVMHVSLDGFDAVLKDHNACDRRFGHWVGPLLARREGRALQMLDGVAGVPRLLARPDRRSLLMEHVRARPHRQLELDVDRWRRFFERLAAQVTRMHERGVAHCDLRSVNNVLVDDRERPWLVDFVACCFRGRRWNLVAGWVFRQFCRADWMALARLKARISIELLDDRDRRLLARSSLLDRGARRFGHWVRDVSRALMVRR